jgi:NMD protein affecting ribosome stability and mRNA decay
LDLPHERILDGRNYRDLLAFEEDFEEKEGGVDERSGSMSEARKIEDESGKSE